MVLPEEKFAIGLDLGQTAIKCGIVGPDGSIKEAWQQENLAFFQPKVTIGLLTSAIQKALELASRQKIAISGIGISSTLDVDPESGIIRFRNSEILRDWQNFSISQFFQEEFGISTIVENDGIAAAWGEYLAGAGQGSGSMVGLTLGTGIGGGVILDGLRLGSSLGSGAYFGHMSIDINGPECPNCPQRGCWELFVSGKAFERQARERLALGAFSSLPSKNPTGKDIILAAQSGDELSKALVYQAACYLGVGLVNLANIFNPERIVIGGGLLHAGSMLLQPAIEYFNNHRMLLRPNVDILIARLGIYSGMVGAALLSLDKPAK